MKDTDRFELLFNEYQSQEPRNEKEDSVSKLYLAYDYVDNCGEKDQRCCADAITGYLCCGC